MPLVKRGAESSTVRLNIFVFDNLSTTQYSAFAAGKSSQEKEEVRLSKGGLALLK